METPQPTSAADQNPQPETPPVVAPTPPETQPVVPPTPTVDVRLFLAESLNILKRIEMYVWNGQACVSWREFFKLKAVLAGFPAYQENLFMIRQTIYDGKLVQAHAEVMRLRNRLEQDYKKLRQ